MMKYDKISQLIVELCFEIIANILSPWLDTQPLADRILWVIVLTMAKHLVIYAMEE